MFATVTVIFLQGFQLAGFQLEKDFLHWLGIPTVGQVAGLMVLFYGALFKEKKAREDHAGESITFREFQMFGPHGQKYGKTACELQKENRY
ncbi:MAG: hypothetical protein H0W49_06525 [Nitrospirales bacterium]|nr:hypothetical protein [Nitrospirales bacterium]MBA3967617.1 hypothetical protein [Nitrospirales bacterium]